jgi:small subunit ribosomal protein S20
MLVYFNLPVSASNWGEAMPHTRSAKKRLRQYEKRRMRNRATKAAIKTQLKTVLAVAKQGTLDQLRQEFNLAAKKLDKAAARRVVHPNLAARKKSQLARLVHAKETAGKTGS